MCFNLKIYLFIVILHKFIPEENVVIVETILLFRNYHYTGQLPTWSMLSVPVEGGGASEPQNTPPGQASSPSASPNLCGTSAPNCSPRSSTYRTSPMAVPSPGRFRNRQDSSGSVSTGRYVTR